jgi:hypothetical protein
MLYLGSSTTVAGKPALEEAVMRHNNTQISPKQIETLYQSAIKLQASNLDVALQQLSEAAECGHPPALNHLGMLYLVGRQVPLNVTRGIDYLEKAANQGISEARYTLGMTFIQGSLVRRDIQRGLRYLAIAAKHGHAKSDSQWRWCMALEGVLWSRPKY